MKKIKQVAVKECESRGEEWIQTRPYLWQEETNKQQARGVRPNVADRGSN